jgi:uridine phosphorylase
MSITELPITGLPVGRVNARVIVCGDPARADRIAKRLDEVALLSHKREYRAHNGVYGGVPITVCSHGIGAPGAAIAFEELAAAGAKTIVRVGTCGGLQPDLGPGGVVIATAAVSNNGYTREVVPDGFPAVADPTITAALRRAWQAHPATASPGRIGTVLSRDAFYQGLAAPAIPDYLMLSRGGALAVEMECAALFIVGALRQVATGAILAVDGNVLEVGESFDSYRPGREEVQTALDAAITCALQALLDGA